MAEDFRVGFTADFFKPDGTSLLGDIGLGLLAAAPGVEQTVVPIDGPEVKAEQLVGIDALALLGRRLTADSLAGNDRLAIVARYGVGYDNVDVAACTEAGVALTITPEGVRRPMATVNLCFLLALSHRLLEQDRLMRAGGWARKTEVMGTGLVGRTLGIIGLGNIARETFAIAKPLGLRFVAFDPFAPPGAGEDLGVERVDLETLLRESDFVVVSCALTPETHHLLDAERLALMKPTAYLISTARGPIVDQAALTEALREKRLAGAGIDVYEQEPPDPDDPLLALDNAIVTPHALCWTDEWIRVTGEVACRAMLDVAAGEVPANVVNKEVLETPRFVAKLRHYREAAEGR